MPTATPIGLAPQPVRSIAAPGPQNPQDDGLAPKQQDPQQPSYFSDGGVSAEDQQTIIKTLQAYRGGWMQDRQERIRVWMRSVMMEKGIQCLGWDSSSNTWYDALADFRNSNLQQDGETVELEKWMNNITLMFKQVFVGNLTRAVPKSIVRPENAEKPTDVQTAKSAQDVITILDRKNKVRKMLRAIYENLFTFGCYFRYTRPVLDGVENGYEVENYFEDMEVQTPSRMKCMGCGLETPMSDLTSRQTGQQQSQAPPIGGMGTRPMYACPGCDTKMGAESYFAAGEGNRTSMQVAGTKRTPRASVRQSIHSPLEIDINPEATEWWQSPILAKDSEIDIGEALKLFPAFRDRIKPGANTSTTPNADFERLQRTQMKSVTSGYAADLEMSRPTFSENWMQPTSYFKLMDYGFAERMEKQYPDGMKVAMIGDVIVDIRKAVLRREWSHCHLYEGYGPYCPSIAERVVPFNLRFNDVMQTLDDWASRAATGFNVVDGARIDSEKIDKVPMSPAHVFAVPMRINGETRPLSEVFQHFDLPLNPALWNYPQMLLTFCQLIAGLPPQAFGAGTQQGVDTATGQEQMLATATQGLQPYWENVKDECADAARNAIECAKVLMQSGGMTQIWKVEETRGAGYRNKMVDWSMMQGQVEVFSDEDQGLPTTPDELRSTITMMFKELTSGNPAAKEWFDVPENSQMVLSTMLPGSVSPTEAQVTKTEIDLNTLVDTPSEPQIGQDGQVTMKLPAMPGKFENFEIAKAITQKFLLENCDLQNSDPEAWERLTGYYDALEDADAAVAAEKAQRQAAVTAAGQPQKPGPDPTLMGEVHALLQQAGPALQRLSVIAQMDPMMTKGTANAQVSAASTIVKSALDAGKAMAQ